MVSMLKMRKTLTAKRLQVTLLSLLWICYLCRAASIPKLKYKPKNELDTSKNIDSLGNDLGEGGIDVDPKQNHEEENDVNRIPDVAMAFDIQDEDDDDKGIGHRKPLKPLKLGDLQPADHLDAVRMEQDGHLNRDYKKEIFLGNHEEIEQGTPKEVRKKLEDIFHKVDTDHDEYLTHEELVSWIIKKIQEHFKEASEENEKIFKALDTDNDGYITWDEFHVEFLKAKGYEEELAVKHVADYDAINLIEDDRDMLVRFKYRWTEADEEPQNNKLTMAELKSFRHPEQSKNMLNRMVEDILDNLDKDHDKIITEQEFIALPPGEVEPQFKDADQEWQDERAKEFRKHVDLDHNGKVTIEELKNYVDPSNPNHSRMEADNLMELGDEDHDKKLSLKEVLDNMELFLGSKMVDTGRSFHDEF